MKEPPHTRCQEQDFCEEGSFTNFGRASFPPTVLGGGIVVEKPSHGSQFKLDLMDAAMS